MCRKIFPGPCMKFIIAGIVMPGLTYITLQSIFLPTQFKCNSSHPFRLILYCNIFELRTWWIKISFEKGHKYKVHTVQHYTEFPPHPDPEMRFSNNLDFSRKPGVFDETLSPWSRNFGHDCIGKNPVFKSLRKSRCERTCTFPMCSVPLRSLS